MKNLKLFQKTYLFTMVLMGIIIIISHILLYIFLPAFYINKAKNQINKISREFIENSENTDKDNCIIIGKDLAEKYNVNIELMFEDKIYKFEVVKYIDMYMKSDIINDNQLIISNDENYIKSEEVNDYNNDSNDMEYFRMKNNTIIDSKKFSTSDGSNAVFRITMDMESFEEARGVIFRILPYSLIMSIIISLFASYIYAKIITDPIKKICDSTKEMKILNENALCIVNTGDEIEVLAEDINSLYKILWQTIDSLKKEIDNVEKSEKAKVEFLRSASHELKTPLMSMHIMLENMIFNIGKYKNHDVYLSKCKDIVVDLSSMIQEILDTSRLNGHNNIEYACINLESFIGKIADSYKIIAKSKHIDMSIDYSDSFNIDSDEKLLSKALSNVISNAVNYTNEGSKIKIYFKEDLLIIENECEPISEEDLKHIFDAFYRADFDRNKNTGGNGLGLYIVKQILTVLNIPHYFENIDNGMRFTMDFKDNRHV